MTKLNNFIKIIIFLILSISLKAITLQQAFLDNNISQIQNIILTQKDIELNKLYYVKKYDVYTTPLIYSIVYNRKKLFDYLLKTNIDINKTNKSNMPPIYYALQTLEYTYLEALLKRDTIKIIQDKSLYYFVRVDFNFLAKIKLLKKYGVKVDDDIIKFYKQKYKKYKVLYDKIEKFTIKEVVKLKDLPSSYKIIIKKENSKKTILRSINYQLILLKNVLEVL